MKLMLKRRIPTSNTVRDFLLAHDPSVRVLSEFHSPLEMVMRGVDILLEAEIKFDEVSLSSSVSYFYASGP